MQGMGGDPVQMLVQSLSQALSTIMKAGPQTMPQMLPILRGFFGEVDKMIAPARQGMQAGPAAGGMGGRPPQPAGPTARPGMGAPQRPM